LHATKSLYIQKEQLKATRGAKVYATSAFCSMAEEGIANPSPEVNGGAGSSIVGAGIVDAVEAAEGEIIATSAGANFFAFSKKTFISLRVRPWGELIFSQSISTMRKRKCNSTLSTALQREPLQLEGRVFNCIEGLGKILQAILWDFCLLFWPQPEE
jgi:hypothetical protein